MSATNNIVDSRKSPVTLNAQHLLDTSSILPRLRSPRLPFRSGGVGGSQESVVRTLRGSRQHVADAHPTQFLCDRIWSSAPALTAPSKADVWQRFVDDNYDRATIVGFRWRLSA